VISLENLGPRHWFPTRITRLSRKICVVQDRLNIRKATEDDSAVLASIIRESFQDVAKQFRLDSINCPAHPSNCSEEWVLSDFAEGKVYFIAEKDIPIGCVVFEKINEKSCKLGRLAVLPSFRLKGIGKKLIQTVESEAKSCGIEQIDISIIAEHKSLRKWYLNLGFVEGDRTRFEHLPFEVLFMNKKLK
jgi:diamine N-acetyltransferase